MKQLLINSFVASKPKFDAENKASKIEGPYEFIDVKINKGIEFSFEKCLIKYSFVL